MDKAGSGPSVNERLAPLAKPGVHRVTEILRGFFLAFFFIALPVSSFPYLPDALGGRALERPMAIYPLIALLLLVTLPGLVSRPLPRTFLPLFAFVTAALVGSLIAFSGGTEVFRGVSLGDRFLRNLATLALGCAFYLTVVMLPRTWNELRASLRWLYFGMAAALAWGSLQALYVIHYHSRYFRLLNEIQKLISTRKLFPTRISGPAYEPKWFAEQICFLLMPWLIASVITRRTVFPRPFGRIHRLNWVTLEMLLLVWASGVLLFTFSRTGWFILALLAVVGFWMFRASTQKSTSPGAARRSRLRRIIEPTLLVVVLASGIFAFGSQNPYFSRLWRYWTENKARNRTYLEYIAFDQRFVYWTTAMRMYQTQPLVGVGLGNYAFFFADLLPDQPYDVQKEVMRQITPGDGRDRLLTPKNLYARLIAETGLIGTAFFTAFLVAVFGCVQYLRHSPTSEQRFWAAGGLLSLMVLMVVIFSFDSFARPNMWVALGLITAAAHLRDPESDIVDDQGVQPLPGETGRMN